MGRHREDLRQLARQLLVGPEVVGELGRLGLVGPPAHLERTEGGASTPVAPVARQRVGVGLGGDEAVGDPRCDLDGLGPEA